MLAGRRSVLEGKFMKIGREELIAGVMTSGLVLTTPPPRAQDDEASRPDGRGRGRGVPAPKRTVAIERLFKTESKNLDALFRFKL
jgi:hypothetical protein